MWQRRPADVRGAEVMRKTKVGRVLKVILSLLILVGTNLERAKLDNANLTSANLRQANLEGSTLIDTKVQGARYDAHTRWPTGFNPGRAGAILSK
jgi:uncharacterized protein YjbI with pentapeptide repeats